MFSKITYHQQLATQVLSVEWLQSSPKTTVSVFNRSPQSKAQQLEERTEQFFCLWKLSGCLFETVCWYVSHLKCWLLLPIFTEHLCNYLIRVSAECVIFLNCIVLDTNKIWRYIHMWNLRGLACTGTIYKCKEFSWVNTCKLLYPKFLCG